MTMSRILATPTRVCALAVATVALALSGLATSAGPADAAQQGTRPCASYYYCFYEHSNYGGWQLQYKTTSYGSFVVPPSTTSRNRQDKVSSIINNGSRTICVYNYRPNNEGVNVLRVKPHQDIVNMGFTSQGNWNDAADYWRTFAGSVACPGR